jgi:poly-gamma-glutamate synthesis protein (capsule biosynthesis protein)
MGRGLDRILPHPRDPELLGACTDDARAYVGLAERVNGPSPVGFCWPRGDAMPVLEEMAQDVRVISLETSVTCRTSFLPRRRRALAKPGPKGLMPRTVDPTVTRGTRGV